MDKSKFELTRPEIKDALIKTHCPDELINQLLGSITLYWKLGWIQEILRRQVDAVLSMFEPVELEALGDEEIFKLVTDYHFSGEENRHILANNVSQATIQKNQKGQLFRLKEE